MGCWLDLLLLLCRRTSQIFQPSLVFRDCDPFDSIWSSTTPHCFWEGPGSFLSSVAEFKDLIHAKNQPKKHTHTHTCQLENKFWNLRFWRKNVQPLEEIFALLCFAAEFKSDPMLCWFLTWFWLSGHGSLHIFAGSHEAADDRCTLWSTSVWGFGFLFGSCSSITTTCTNWSCQCLGCTTSHFLCWTQGTSVVTFMKHDDSSSFWKTNIQPGHVRESKYSRLNQWMKFSHAEDLIQFLVFLLQQISRGHMHWGRIDLHGWMDAGFCCFFPGIAWSASCKGSCRLPENKTPWIHIHCSGSPVLPNSDACAHRSVLDYFLNFFVMTFGALAAFLSHFVISKWLMVYPRF